MEIDHQHSPSFRNKLKMKTSIICNFSCCNYSDTEPEDEQKVLEASENTRPPPLSLSTWIRSELPEIKDRCVSLFSGKIGGRNRHRPNSAEFRYDPLSYALNFEDDDSRIDEFPLRNFSARLPPSPPPQKNNTVVVSREIAAWS